MIQRKLSRPSDEFVIDASEYNVGHSSSGSNSSGRMMMAASCFFISLGALLIYGSLPKTRSLERTSLQASAGQLYSKNAARGEGVRGAPEAAVTTETTGVSAEEGGVVTVDGVHVDSRQGGVVITDSDFPGPLTPCYTAAPCVVGECSRGV